MLAINNVNIKKLSFVLISTGIFTYLFMFWTLFYIAGGMVGFSIYSFFKNGSKPMGTYALQLSLAFFVAMLLGSYKFI